MDYRVFNSNKNEVIFTHRRNQVAFKSLLAIVAISAALTGCSKKEAKAADNPIAGSPLAVADKVDAPEAGAQQKAEPEKPNYTLVSPNQPVMVDKKNRVTLEIHPVDGLKINQDFPWKVKFKSKNDLQVDEKELTSDQIDMNAKRVRLTVDVTPTNEGVHDLEGVGTFAVCNLKLCDIHRNEPLRFTLIAEPEAS